MSQTMTISAIIIASIFISLVVGQTCPAGVNLVTNPSFETPPAPPGSYASVPLDGIPGWQGVLVDPSCPTPGTLDVLNNFNGYMASDGNQYVELDAQCNTAIIQDIQTVPGQLYVLSYDYSPRPGVDAASDVANVYFNGDRINSVSASGIGLTNTNWTTYTQLVTGAGPDELVFEGLGISDTQGSFIDNVYLCPLVCDPPRPCYSLMMDPVLGCNYVPAPDGTPCSASCSRYVCQAGTCVPPPVPCDQPDDHKYYPGYHYEHKEYKYQQSYGHHEIHYGYGYQYTPVHHGDDDDYKYKPEYKPKHYGDADDYKYKPEYKPKEDEYKPKEYKPKDYGYKSEEDEYKPKYEEDEYKPKEYKPKDYGYKSEEEYEYEPKEYKPKEYKPKDYGYKSEEDEYKPKEYKPKDYGYKSEEDEYKPKYEEDEYKPKEYKPKDYGYKSEEEYEYEPKEYKPKDYEYKSEEDEYKPKEYKPKYEEEYKPKHYEYKSEDYEYKPEYKPKEYKSKDYGYKSEEEYKPKESKGYGYHENDYEPDFDFDDYFKVDDHEYSSGSGGRRSHHH